MDPNSCASDSYYFGEALSLMKRDASFAVGVWQLSYLGREGSIGLVETQRRANELGQMLAARKGIPAEDASDWLLDDVDRLNDYFEKHHEYGTSLHKASAVALLLRRLFLEHKLPTRLERDAI